MKPPEQGAYLALSAAAVREFFDGDIRGLRLRTAGDVVTMKGVQTTSGADVVSVEHRGRGGLFAQIDAGGRNTAELLQLLRQAGYRMSSPYFLLRPRPREWVGIEHWTARKPPLNQPFMRVYMSESRRRKAAAAGPKRRAAARPLREVGTSETVDWRMVRRVLTNDAALLARGGEGRGSQRRTRARRDLEQFERLISVVLPEHEDAGSLQTRLDRMSAQLERANQERDAANEELVALQRVLDDERRQRRAMERGHVPESPSDEPDQAERPPEGTRSGRSRRRRFHVADVTQEDVRAVSEAEQVTPAMVEPFERTTEPLPYDEHAAEVEGAGGSEEVEAGTETETTAQAEEAEVADVEDLIDQELAGEQSAVDQRAEPETEDATQRVTEGEEETSEEGASKPPSSTEDETEREEQPPTDEQPPTGNIRFPEEDNDKI